MALGPLGYRKGNRDAPCAGAAALVFLSTVTEKQGSFLLRNPRSCTSPINIQRPIYPSEFSSSTVNARQLRRPLPSLPGTHFIDSKSSSNSPSNYRTKPLADLWDLGRGVVSSIEYLSFVFQT
jgi:hypothetical protein